MTKHLHHVLLLLGVLAAFLGTCPARAQMPEQEPVARLVPGGLGTNGARRAGIEITLPPGWKTYWRYAGENGIPPRFDWTGSENLASLKIAFPAPIRFGEGRNVSFGYTRSTVFIVNALPQDLKQPIVLKLKLEYAVCEKICLPKSADLSLTLPPSPANSPSVTNALRTIPFKVSFGEQDKSYLAVLSCHIDKTQTPAQYDVIVTTAPNEPASDLFVEGPDSTWELPIPLWLGQNEEGNQKFAFRFTGAPKGAEPGKHPLRLTVTSGSRAIEVDACME